MSKKIISTGHSVALLRVRNAMIQKAGYEVATSKESAMILEMVEKQDFAAAVLCSSIPIQIRTHLAREIRRLKPDLPLIVIFSDGEEQQLRGVADQLVPSTQGIAQLLLEAIARAAGEPDGDIPQAA